MSLRMFITVLFLNNIRLCLRW